MSETETQPEQKPAFVVAASIDLSTGEFVKQSRLVSFTVKTIASIGNFKEVISESFPNVDEVLLQNSSERGFLTEIKADSSEEINLFISTFMSKFIYDAPIESETQPEAVIQEKSKTNSRKGNKGNKKVAVVEEVAVAPDEIQPGIGNTPFQITLEKGWLGNSEEGQEEDEQPKTIAQKIAELQESPWLAEAEARKLQQELAGTPVQKIQPKTKWWNPFTWFGN
jgi:hypothetical protein